MNSPSESTCQGHCSVTPDLQPLLQSYAGIQWCDQDHDWDHMISHDPSLFNMILAPLFAMKVAYIVAKKREISQRLQLTFVTNQFVPG